jgi:hypothetical protein
MTDKQPHHPDHWDATTVTDITELLTHVEAHIDKRFDELKELVKATVPNGDLEGHRRAHEQWLIEAKDGKEMRTKVLTKLAEGTAWAALVAVGTAVWYWVKEHLK